MFGICDFLRVGCDHRVGRTTASARESGGMRFFCVPFWDWGGEKTMKTIFSSAFWATGGAILRGSKREVSRAEDFLPGHTLWAEGALPGISVRLRSVSKV